MVNASAHTKLDVMLTCCDGSVILNFVSVDGLHQISLVISATGESAADVHGRGGIQNGLLAARAHILKVGFVDGAIVKRLGVTGLQRVLSIELVEALGWQAELADAVVDFIFAEILIARSEGVAGGKLIVDPRSQIGASTRIGDSVSELSGIKTLIEGWSVDDGNLVEIAAVKIKKEGSSLVDRPTDIAAIENGMVSRLKGGAFERVSRIKGGIVAID